MSGELQGVEQLVARLKELEEKVAKRYIKQALRAGGQVVRKEAITKAKTFDRSESPETIWKNIAIRTNKYGIIRVGVLGGAKKDDGKPVLPGGDTWYWRFLEFGVPARGIPAKPFLRAAAMENVGKVYTAVSDKLEQLLIKELEHRK